MIVLRVCGGGLRLPQCHQHAAGVSPTLSYICHMACLKVCGGGLLLPQRHRYAAGASGKRSHQPVHGVSLRCCSNPGILSSACTRWCGAELACHMAVISGVAWHPAALPVKLACRFNSSSCRQRGRVAQPAENACQGQGEGMLCLGSFNGLASGRCCPMLMGT